jgi:hypothetical protein
MFIVVGTKSYLTITRICIRNLVETVTSDNWFY